MYLLDDGNYLSGQGDVAARIRAREDGLMVIVGQLTLVVQLKESLSDRRRVGIDVSWTPGGCEKGPDVSWWGPPRVPCS